MIFELHRLDVWPVGDLGVRQGYALAWGLDDVPTAAELVPIGERFRPYRSIVARYRWAALDVLERDPLPGHADHNDHHLPPTKRT